MNGFQYAKHLDSFCPDIHLTILFRFHDLFNLHQRSEIGHLIIDYGRNAEIFLLFKTFADQLFIPRLKDVEV
jgi:hypothetical protein